MGAGGRGEGKQSNKLTHFLFAPRSKGRGNHVRKGRPVGKLDSKPHRRVLCQGRELGLRRGVGPLWRWRWRAQGVNTRAVDLGKGVPISSVLGLRKQSSTSSPN